MIHVVSISDRSTPQGFFEAVLESDQDLPGGLAEIASAAAIDALESHLRTVQGIAGVEYSDRDIQGSETVEKEAGQENSPDVVRARRHVYFRPAS